MTGLELLVWPGVVVVLGGAGICVCRTQLGGLVNRITKIDKGGITAVPQEVARMRDATVEVLADSRQLMEVNFNEVIRQQENTIKAQMAKIKFTDPAEREPFLVRALARSQVFATFDRLSIIVFGSQLEILVACNGAADGVQEDAFRSRFPALKAADPVFHENTVYETYIGFLLNSNLLMREGTALKITILGREFLKFLVDSGATYRRRG